MSLRHEKQSVLVLAQQIVYYFEMISSLAVNVNFYLRSVHVFVGVAFTWLLRVKYRGRCIDFEFINLDLERCEFE